MVKPVKPTGGGRKTPAQRRKEEREQRAKEKAAEEAAAQRTLEDERRGAMEAEAEAASMAAAMAAAPAAEPPGVAVSRPTPQISPEKAGGGASADIEGGEGAIVFSPGAGGRNGPRFDSLAREDGGDGGGSAEKKGGERKGGGNGVDAAYNTATDVTMGGSGKKGDGEVIARAEEKTGSES